MGNQRAGASEREPLSRDGAQRYLGHIGPNERQARLVRVVIGHGGDGTSGLVPADASSG